MTNKEILTKAIEKAIRNGYTEYVAHYDISAPYADSEFDIIFSHDFAKAFWGTEEVIEIEEYGFTEQAWKHHLMRMVLEDDPLKYLERFLT